MYQPRPAFTPIISAIMMAVQALLIACVIPCRMLGIACGMATLKDQLTLSSAQGAGSFKVLFVYIENDRVIEATVTANQEPKAMMKIAPLNRELQTTMIIGIQVEVGIRPKNLMIGSTQ